MANVNEPCSVAGFDLPAWCNALIGFWLADDAFDSVKTVMETWILSNSLFPTCQVRVVRFYQSACPPPLLPLPPPRLAVLLALLLASASSTSTSALPTLPTRRQALRQLPSSVRTAGPQPGTFPAQWAPLDLNLGPAELSEHRWTSTWDLPSSVSTAGPQPGTFPAQCAPLDLNLGFSELSVHRWTSTAR